jgi:penicillin V acylase-like amidase (Ntn superfamily)
MKRLLLLFSLLILLNSCDTETESIAIVTLPVESVEIPSSFVLGETYQIKMNYYRPTSCHTPYGIYYKKDLNKRICAINNLLYDRNDCNNLNNVLVSETFNFQVTNTGNYIFRFWTGKDNQGNLTYLEYDIPVN